jgi:hypothetical protein
MGIVIREADLAADRELLLATLLHNRDHGDNDLRRARFEWSYFQNPFGKPRAWLAIDTSSSRAVGMVAAFPRQIKVNNAIVQGWNGGDTSVDRAFRTLGVALKLRGAVKACVDRHEMPFVYSHPVDRMQVVLKRVGHHIIGSFVRYGLILRTDQLLQKLSGYCPGVSILTSLTNILPPLQWKHRFAGKKFCVRLLPGNSFGNEFDDLYQRVCQRYPVMAVRDSAFLHWRFTKNPGVKDFRIFCLEETGRFQGYAVIGFEKSAARIMDMLIDGDRLAMRSMLLGVIRWLRANRLCTLSLRATASSLILMEARPLGFLFQDRRDAGVAVYTADSAPLATLMDEKNWFMTPADRDV